MNIFYIIAFLLGTGFGWCLCSPLFFGGYSSEVSGHETASEEVRKNMG